MLTLYHAPASRSSRIVWLLEELGAPYEGVVAALHANRNLLGDRFTAADLVLASVAQWSRDALPKGNPVDDWLARANARPALARAMARDGG